MLKKNQINLKFNPKRNFNLTTPCCNRSNKDGKFSTFVDLPDNFGYCHSCGIKTVPPALYKDEKGNEFIWNEIQNKFEPLINTFQNSFHTNQNQLPNTVSNLKEIKYIPETIIWKYFNISPENNLVKYLRKTYGNEKVDAAKELYAIGTSEDGGTIFWNINSEMKVQKAKICYYNENGKRTNKFKVPYKNENGYFACLFGAHLVYDNIKGKKTIILCESEKTTIVGHILLPQYVWVAYGGINGLTDNKVYCLIGHNVVIVPDMSENAVSIMYDKLLHLHSLGIKATVWDMTEGKTDQELKSQGLYNCDLEDIFRRLPF